RTTCRGSAAKRESLARRSAASRPPPPSRSSHRPTADAPGRCDRPAASLHATSIRGATGLDATALFETHDGGRTWRRASLPRRYRRQLHESRRAVNAQTVDAPASSLLVLVLRDSAEC